MLLDGRATRTIRAEPDGSAVVVIDQRLLPHRVDFVRITDARQAAEAIANMTVRGAPLIGVTAAYGLALQTRADAGDAALHAAAAMLKAARPTAVNLAWAVDRLLRETEPSPAHERAQRAWQLAGRLADEDVAINQAIGRHGLALLRELSRAKDGASLNVLTHCNAGWLAAVDWGTALAPIYAARRDGIDVHVWVSETRPRNQGAALTAFELREEGVPHTVIADNAAGHLMQRGRIDAVIVGCDRVGARGDVANKVGTYLKALAARECGVPFWVAMPLSTLDAAIDDGIAEIPIEERDARELTHVGGRGADGEIGEVQVVPDGTAAANPAFDVTPARLVAALITEVGVVPATPAGIGSLSGGPPPPNPLPPAREGARRDIVAAVHRVAALGLNRGSTGNVSVRAGEGGMWITPTGIGAAGLRADHIVRVADDGSVQHGAWQPSSESPFHRAIYRARPDLAAVVHVHAVHAAALSCLRRELPAFHYMVAIAGGDSVPCTPYFAFGSEALAQAVADAFRDRDACLMANHGLVAGGRSLEQAMKVAIEVEALCETYLKAIAAGEPALLTREQMDHAIEQFRSYGKAARR